MKKILTNKYVRITLTIFILGLSSYASQTNDETLKSVATVLSVIVSGTSP